MYVHVYPTGHYGFFRKVEDLGIRCCGIYKTVFYTFYGIPRNNNGFVGEYFTIAGINNFSAVEIGFLRNE